MHRPPAPRRPLNPFLFRRAAASSINLNVLARAAGWVHYSHFYTDLHAEKIIATAKTVDRLMRLADLLEFPRDEVFLDELPKPRLVKRESASADATSDAESAR